MCFLPLQFLLFHDLSLTFIDFTLLLCNTLCEKLFHVLLTDEAVGRIWLFIQKYRRKQPHCCPVLVFHFSKSLIENDFRWKMTGLLSVKLPQRIFKKWPFKRWCGLFITSCIPFALMAAQYVILYNPCNFHYQAATLHFFLCWLIYLQIIYSSQDRAIQLEEKNNVKAEHE